MNNQNNKIKTYVLGGLIGAVIGVVTALLIDRSSELEGNEFKFNGKKASKTAMGVISLLWSLIEKG